MQLIKQHWEIAISHHCTSTIQGGQKDKLNIEILTKIENKVTEQNHALLFTLLFTEIPSLTFDLSWAPVFPSYFILLIHSSNSYYSFLFYTITFYFSLWIARDRITQMIHLITQEKIKKKIGFNMERNHGKWLSFFPVSLFFSLPWSVPVSFSILNIYIYFSSLHVVQYVFTG